MQIVIQLGNAKHKFLIDTSTFFRLRKIRNENGRRDRGKEREMERKRKKKDWQKGRD